VDITVVCCTYKPVPAILGWALDSIENQSLPTDRFEVLIVDNNSPQPVADLAVVKNRKFKIRVVREARKGVVFARCRGISETTTPLVAFLDDDNHFAPDYLEVAVDIADRHPELGAFGGISRMLTEGNYEAWKEPLLPYIAVRNYGTEPITSRENRWGHWEPVGAGMIFRKQIGDAFVRFVENNQLAWKLGRNGGKKFAGEDSVLARLSYPLGYACSYQPALKLTHFIRSERLRARAIFDVIEGIGRSYVLIEILLNNGTFKSEGTVAGWKHVWNCAQSRAAKYGWKAGLLETGWDVGFMRQVRECAREALPVVAPVLTHAAGGSQAD